MHVQMLLILEAAAQGSLLSARKSQASVNASSLQVAVLSFGGILLSVQARACRETLPRVHGLQDLAIGEGFNAQGLPRHNVVL